MFSTTEVLLIAGIMSAFAYGMGFRRGHLAGFAMGVLIVLRRIDAMPEGKEVLRDLERHERAYHDQKTTA